MPTERMKKSEIKPKSKLKPCPFCGGEARFVQTARWTSEKFHFEIRCVKCDATAPDAHGSVNVILDEDGTLNSWRDDRPKAIEAWNRRAGQ